MELIKVKGSSVWLQSENKSLLPNASHSQCCKNCSERFSKCSPVAVSAAWHGSSHSVACTIHLHSSTCFTCFLLDSISGLLPLPCKQQEPPGWHLGKFWLISDGPKSSSDDLQSNLMFSVLQQRFPFPTTLTLNFAFL